MSGNNLILDNQLTYDLVNNTIQQNVSDKP